MRELICLIGKLFFIGKKQSIDQDNIKNILIIRSGALGDVIMTTPFIRSVRKNYPHAKISYLVGEWSASVLKNNPFIDEVITFNDNIINKKRFFGIVTLIKKVKLKKFDTAFILDKSYLWNLFAFFSGIVYRIGFDRDGEGFPNTINVPFDGKKYELEYNLDLLKKMRLKIIDTKMELFPSQSDFEKAKEIIRKTKGIVIGIAPGGAKNPGQEMAEKRWPREKYLELIKKLTTHKNISIMLFGGPTDTDIGKFIELNTQKKRMINLIGKTNLHQSYLLMKKCKVVITHDSGPLHLAAASGTKIIALFGPTPPHRFAPKNAMILYKGTPEKPGYDIYGNVTRKDYMSMIDVEEVYKKTISLL